MDTHEAGFYRLSRKDVRRYLIQQSEPTSTTEPDGTGNPAHPGEQDAGPPGVDLGTHSISKEAEQEPTSEQEPISEQEPTSEQSQDQPTDPDAQPRPPKVTKTGVPECERCHNLRSYNRGVAIAHPSVQSIAATIAESPHRRDHIYHVLDAADFPLSLVPNLHQLLHLATPRTQNRRSKDQRWHRGKNTEISFVITRADLLAPTKEQVDRLMPYLMEVLRSALGRTGKNIRLGNLRCVSSKRGWWTKAVKESVYNRGGGNWLVGKANVGKSNLFEVIFPRGGGRPQIKPEEQPTTAGSDEQPATRPDPLEEDYPEELDPAAALAKMKMLPPAQPYVPYPPLPLVSSLAGTTASPIRVPFGSSSGRKPRGELIDLPGLPRSLLENAVVPERRKELLMEHRVMPDRESIKPGQSMLIGGGLVRITPRFPSETVFLATAFVPVAVGSHVTSTLKAEEIEKGERETGINRLISAEGQTSFASAGTFTLRWDVTKPNSGPLTRRDDVGFQPHQLPFIILGADVLVEGVGWVEMTAQLRRRWLEDAVRERLKELDGKLPERSAGETLLDDGQSVEVKETGSPPLDGGQVVEPVQDEASASTEAETLAIEDDALTPKHKRQPSHEVESAPSDDTEGLAPGDGALQPQDDTLPSGRTEASTPGETESLTSSDKTASSKPEALPSEERKTGLFVPFCPQRPLDDPKESATLPDFRTMPIADLLAQAHALGLLPRIEVFSPNGGHVGLRQPLNGFEMGGRKKGPKHSRPTRPRESMRSIKGRRAPGTATGVSSKSSPLTKR